METQRPEITIPNESKDQEKESIGIEFEYSPESELHYLTGLIPKLADLSANYKVIIPTQLREKDLATLTQSEIEEAIKQDMDYETAAIMTKELEGEYERNKKLIEKYLQELPGEKPKEIRVIWTKYGPGGSYGAPGVTVLRFNAAVEPFHNFIHELTHSIVDDSLIQRYKLTHPEKESIVGYLVKRIMPEKGYGQFSEPSEELLKRVGLK